MLELKEKASMIHRTIAKVIAAVLHEGVTRLKRTTEKSRIAILMSSIKALKGARQVP
jgi:hypothetical protein